MPTARWYDSIGCMTAGHADLTVRRQDCVALAIQRVEIRPTIASLACRAGGPSAGKPPCRSFRVDETCIFADRWVELDSSSPQRSTIRTVVQGRASAYVVVTQIGRNLTRHDGIGKSVENVPEFGFFAWDERTSLCCVDLLHEPAFVPVPPC